MLVPLLSYFTPDFNFWVSCRTRHRLFNGDFSISCMIEKLIENHKKSWFFTSFFKTFKFCLLFQIDPSKYKNITSAFKTTIKEQGLKGFTRGWSPTLIGYSAQGAFKYGLYEYAKKYYSDIVGPEYAVKYKTLIYLAGSASAEIVADVALCPMEAVKVRVQTQPGFARGLSDGLPKIVRSEGVHGLFKGLVPLWGRQIPCKSLSSGKCSVIKMKILLKTLELLADTMMKFATFENTVELIYKKVMPTPKEECSESVQLGVSFAGGYIAGIFCAVISHPADNLVSFLNNSKGATVTDVSETLYKSLLHQKTAQNRPLILLMNIHNIYISAATDLVLIVSCATGSKEARVMGSAYPWPSSPHFHDRNTHWSTMGHLWCCQSFSWIVSFLRLHVEIFSSILKSYKNQHMKTLIKYLQFSHFLRPTTGGASPATALAPAVSA